MRFWMIDDMAISPARMSAIADAAIPWCLKPVYGFISDAFLICNERCRPYRHRLSGVTITWWIMPWTVDNTFAATCCMFFGSMSICIADVAADSILVTIARDEKDRVYSVVELGSTRRWRIGRRAAWWIIRRNNWK